MLFRKIVQKTHAKLLLEICDVSNGKHFAASILRGKTSVPSLCKSKRLAVTADATVTKHY